VAAFDAEHLWGCAECGAAVPEVNRSEGHYRGPDWQRPEHCGHCGSSKLGSWPKRRKVPTLEEALVVLRSDWPPPPAPKEPWE
jgi:hypothetical protein